MRIWRWAKSSLPLQCATEVAEAISQSPHTSTPEMCRSAVLTVPWVRRSGRRLTSPWSQENYHSCVQISSTVWFHGCSGRFWRRRYRAHGDRRRSQRFLRAAWVERAVAVHCRGETKVLFASVRERTVSGVLDWGRYVEMLRKSRL